MKNLIYHYDIIFIAETWYDFKEVISDKCFFASTPYPYTEIKAIYYPPSLKGYEFKRYLNNDPQVPDLVIGDFNVDVNKDQPLNKSILLKEYCTKNILEYQNVILKSNDLKLPKWDHLYLKKGLKGKVIDKDDKIRNSYAIKKRYNVKNLSFPYIKNGLINRINEIATLIINNLIDFKNNFKSNNISEKQEIVDIADEILLTNLQDICEEWLGELKENKS
eukprot:jgi/Orpsp1_1/1182081/evm.model.c7180000079786.1